MIISINFGCFRLISINLGLMEINLDQKINYYDQFLPKIFVLKFKLKFFYLLIVINNYKKIYLINSIPISISNKKLQKKHIIIYIWNLNP